ncbi:hypothetical protein FGO68_gene9101 [Halteria grandinella]|uniref:Uncharacterized protein n=1 Tax=Halteria grandinella TaxID=5974 RepID=A0A8J8NNC5_HALGN|nr:hypothetical protein FGO68_gene9101 [Halteria grandinella]
MGKKSHLTQAQREEKKRRKRERKMEKYEQKLLQQEIEQLKAPSGLPQDILHLALLKQQKFNHISKADKGALFQKLSDLYSKYDKQEALKQLPSLDHAQSLPCTSKLALNAKECPLPTALLTALMYDIGQLAFKEQNGANQIFASIWKCLGVVNFSMQKFDVEKIFKFPKGVQCNPTHQSQLTQTDPLDLAKVSFTTPTKPVEIALDSPMLSASRSSSVQLLEMSQVRFLSESQVLTRGQLRQSQIARQSKAIRKVQFKKPERETKRKTKAKGLARMNLNLTSPPRSRRPSKRSFTLNRSTSLKMSSRNPHQETSFSKRSPSTST